MIYDLILEVGAAMNVDITGVFDIAHLKAIHKGLFENKLYDAGRFRTEPIYNSRDEFTKPDKIEMAVELVCDYIKLENYFRGLAPDMLGAKLAAQMVKLNHIHPFMDGNHRTQMIFLQQLAANAGSDLDLSKMSRDDMKSALGQAETGSYIELIKLFQSALTHTGMMGPVVYTPEPEKPRKSLFDFFRRRK